MTWEKYLLSLVFLFAGVLAGESLSTTTLDGKVHSYLMKHPEVLVEMSTALQQKQQVAALEKSSAAIKANAQALFADTEAPVIGDPKGDVTIVEFFDFQCPYCKAEAENLLRLVADDKHVRVVFKQFPVVGGPGSMTAAQAAMAAMAQGKYADLHTALMRDRTPERRLSDTQVFEIAAKAGLDVERLKQDMETPEIAMKIAASIQLGRDIGVTGTPALVVGGHLVSAMLPLDALKTMVAGERGHRQTNG